MSSSSPSSPEEEKKKKEKFTVDGFAAEAKKRMAAAAAAAAAGSSGNDDGGADVRRERQAALKQLMLETIRNQPIEELAGTLDGAVPPGASLAEMIVYAGACCLVETARCVAIAPVRSMLRGRQDRCLGCADVILHSLTSFSLSKFLRKCQYNIR